MGIAPHRRARLMAALTLIVSAILVVLALWHVYWAFGGTFAKSAAIPEFNGLPTLRPSRIGTLAVALVLLCAAALVAGVGAIVPMPLPHVPLVWCAYVLAALFLARAIGEFRFLGFFKRVRGTRFATLDTLAYAPLCLMLAGAIFTIAWISAV